MKHILNEDNILVREICQEDEDFYLSIYTDEQLMRHIDINSSTSSLEKYFSLALNNTENDLYQFRLFIVVINNTKVGIIGISNISAEHNSVDIGMILTKRSQWKGLSIFLVKRICEYIYNRNIADTIMAKYKTKNLAVLRILKILGFEKHQSNKTNEVFVLKKQS